MISGLLKLMRRLCFAGHQAEFQLSFEIHSSIDSGLPSTGVGCATSRPAHLHFRNQHRGLEDIAVTPAS